MKLSILDQSPVMPGATSEDAFAESVRLARLGEDLGYSRYWIAEHHGLKEWSSSVPEVLLGYIGSQTKKIRIGTGAILLPHYRPFKVAEIAHTLATLFPNRIDLGVGRAPGGSAEASLALSGNFLKNVKHFPETFEELLCFMQSKFSDDHLYRHLHINPQAAVIPDVWLLGTSRKSAILAAEKGIGYAFGHFMSEGDSSEITAEYKKRFKSSQFLKEPYIILATSVICAETSEEAESIANNTLESNWTRLGNDINNKKEKQMYFQSQRKKLIVGDCRKVKNSLTSLAQSHQANEVMVITNTNTYESRVKSYQLLKTKPN